MAIYTVIWIFDIRGMIALLVEASGKLKNFFGAEFDTKSTSLAAILNEINEEQSVHVITLEDPVEFVHSQKKSTVNQREMGADFDTFASGLRSALRQAPKVILVGEMRDKETVEIGLSAQVKCQRRFRNLDDQDGG